jgi:hypothetical protein
MEQQQQPKPVHSENKYEIPTISAECQVLQGKLQTFESENLKLRAELETKIDLSLREFEHLKKRIGEYDNLIHSIRELVK